MKIGIDCRLWNETGVGRYIRNLVDQLQKVDTSNDYILFLQSKDKEKFKVKNSKFKVVETNIHWHSLSEQVKFTSVLNKENLDLVHFPYFSHPIFYNKPFIITIHDLIINHFPTGKASTLPLPLYWLKRFGYDAVMKHAITNSTNILVPLYAVKEDLVKTYGVSEKKVYVTYEGVEPIIKEKTKPYTLNPHPYFLYVGNAYPHKNLAFLVEAFEEFAQEEKDEAKLILVGKDDYFYKRLRAEVGNKKNITFKHTVSDEELFSLYSQALGFVSAAKMEGFGLPPLEAMSSQCPVILSDIPSFKEVCGDAAIYFDHTSNISLKKQLSNVYHFDRKTREHYISRGLARVKDFSWKKMAEQTLEIYTKHS